MDGPATPPGGAAAAPGHHTERLLGTLSEPTSGPTRLMAIPCMGPELIAGPDGKDQYTCGERGGEQPRFLVSEIQVRGFDRAQAAAGRRSGGGRHDQNDPVRARLT
jgi:hypothetical protein